MQLVCEILPRTDATTEQLQSLGRALVEWKRTVLPQLGLQGELVTGSLDDLLAGELPTPAGILIANCARSLLQQGNLDSAIRAYLMELADRNWDAVDLDARALGRRTVCGVIALNQGDANDVPTPDDVRQAYESLRESLPAESVAAVNLKNLVRDTGDTLRHRAEEWDDE